MTHAAPRKRGGRTWILPAVTALVVVGLVATGFLSRAIAVDFASWWPLWVALVAIGIWARGRKVGSLRLGGLVAVASVAVAAVFVIANLQGSMLMPSSAGLLTGSPDSGFDSAGLSARVPGGHVVVGTGTTGVLYTVEPLRRGGNIAAPFAIERSQDGDVSVVLSPSEDPGLFLWAGWSVGLSALPSWTLTLEGHIDADLTALTLNNLQLTGGGEVHLGTAIQSTPVTVSGDFVVHIPDGVPVRVVGPAEIPTDWTRTDTGSSSPTEGQGWVVSIADGAVVEIRVR
ncbi:MAG: hypothetical protein ACFCU2_01255 [Acidimicrobiia bacterium]